MTIEERADNFSAKWLRQDQVQISYDGYMQGATDQRKIDVEKALKVYEDLMTCSGYFPETITAELARMRNKLED